MIKYTRLSNHSSPFLPLRTPSIHIRSNNISTVEEVLSSQLPHSSRNISSRRPRMHQYQAHIVPLMYIQLPRLKHSNLMDHGLSNNIIYSNRNTRRLHHLPHKYNRNTSSPNSTCRLYSSNSLPPLNAYNSSQCTSRHMFPNNNLPNSRNSSTLSIHIRCTTNLPRGLVYLQPQHHTH
jgi:hypothetical protein